MLKLHDFCNRAVGTIGESTRQIVADRIKKGETLEGGIDVGRASQKPTQRDQSRDR